MFVFFYDLMIHELKENTSSIFGNENEADQVSIAVYFVQL